MNAPTNEARRKIIAQCRSLGYDELAEDMKFEALQI
jgi:hypothetical protein